MAKVMISMPDELLAEIDSVARANGRTRSAQIREFSEAAMAQRLRDWREAMAALELDKHAFKPPIGAVEALRQSREERTRKLLGE